MGIDGADEGGVRPGATADRPLVQKLPASKARDQFADIINRVSYRGERVGLERRGGRVAALVPVQDLDLLEALEDRLDVDAARAALAEKDPNIPWTKLKAELGI